MNEQSNDVPSSNGASDAALKACRSLVETIKNDFRISAGETGVERLSQRVADALLSVPRHLFVPESAHGDAYENRALAIESGQTISQPFIVALMTELLRIEPDHRVLEIGTGSGYQAAVLSRLCTQVYTIELDPLLASTATERLARLGYANVEVRCGDGHAGWPEEAPFDGIIVTAAAETFPRSLTHQLARNARMVAPVGPRWSIQWLELVVSHDGVVAAPDRILPVAFVPLRGK